MSRTLARDHLAEDAKRVCPSCGRGPGTGIHCERCGTNLLWRRRLPTRGQWESRSEPTEGAAQERGRLRYLPRELKSLHIGPGQTKRGRLMLALALNETLEPDECITHIFSAAEPAGVRLWLVVSSKRLLCIPGWSVGFFDRRQLRSYELSTLSNLRDRRRVTRSRASFQEASGDRVQFSLKGRRTAGALIKALSTPRPSA